MRQIKEMWTILKWGKANKISFLSNMWENTWRKMSLYINQLSLGYWAVKMLYCMWLLVLICEQKTKKLLKKSVYRHLKGERNYSKTLFSANLPFTLSKLISIALDCSAVEEYEVNQCNLAHQKVTSVVPGRLQSLVAKATAAHQLIAPKSVMRRQAGGPHPGQATCHHGESPASDAWRGTGCFVDGAEQDVQGFLRHFGWPCCNARAVACSRWRDHNPWLQPSREIVRDPNHCWTAIAVLPGFALIP